MADPGGSREIRTPAMTPSMFPGFRFSPTDVELITYYLKNKLEGLEKPVEIIPEVEISSHEPWDLPGKSILESENEWFFFFARGRKYPNGSQSKRATNLGYWKATGKERNVKSGSAVVGTKRTLVFHIGRAPKGERTEWIMHEYCMEGRSQDLVVCRLRKNVDFRGSRRTPLVKGHSRVDIENHTISEGCMEQTGFSENEKACEFCNCHSAENVGSTSEIEQNLPNLTTSAGLPTLGKDSDEDCFSDILKDDIIKLDEPLLPALEPLPVVASKYKPVPEVATGLEQHAEQAPQEQYMRFLQQTSDYKTHCVVQHLVSLRSMRFWQLPLVFLCLSLLVLLASFLLGEKPLKMSLGLFTSSRTCVGHT